MKIQAWFCMCLWFCLMGRSDLSQKRNGGIVHTRIVHCTVSVTETMDVLVQHLRHSPVERALVVVSLLYFNRTLVHILKLSLQIMLLFCCYTSIAHSYAGWSSPTHFVAAHFSCRWCGSTRYSLNNCKIMFPVCSSSQVVWPRTYSETQSTNYVLGRTRQNKQQRI